jgi:myo-inositol-1(or 4)-monophosphatase
MKTIHLTQTPSYHGLRVLSLLKDLLKEPRFRERKKITASKNEVVTEADIAAENLVIDYIKRRNIPVNLDGEEKRRTTLTENPQGLWVLDPLDGTYNYFRNVFPYSSILSIFDSPHPKNLGSAVWTGILNHSTGEIITLKENLQTSGRKSLEGNVEDAEASVIIDLGPKQKLDAYLPYSEIIENSWWRNASSAGFHFFGVATGTLDAYLCPVQKPEELVAGIPLIKKAGVL